MSEGNVDATYPPKVFTETNDTKDTFGDRRSELDSPAMRAFPITPSQGLLPTTIRGLYVGNAGNVFCRMAGGNTTHSPANVFFYNVIGGTILPVRMDGVFTYNIAESDTTQNTTATFLVGLY